MVDELRDILIDLGMRRGVVKVLLLLHRDINSGYTSHEMQERLDMNQPEISMAIKELEYHDWIDSKKERLESGYARKRYSLIISMKEVAEHLKEKNHQIIKELEDNIKRMKELVHNEM